MNKDNIIFTELVDIDEAELADINQLIIDTWAYQEWNKQENVLPMADFFLETILLTSTKVFVAKDKGKIIGVVAAALTPDLFPKSRIRYRQLEALSLIINQGKPETVFDFYLETMKLNEELIQQSKETFDAALNLLILNENYKGLGLGSKLYQFFLDYLKENKAKTFFLLTDSYSNYPFYEKKGLKRIAAQRFSWSNGAEVSEEDVEEYYVYAGRVS
ncbi:GNAT family N-acetyltransferase [Lactococcus petauri]|uniref:GNAT family N-acetyltransferase n=1 Tax=Lactococcus petauri TaxID=1940789 RepID=UPI002078F645|nr:GNAT family N-acetyltransferase [Lactococcus petauri]USI67406.1 GNAT family N-acetyltransferase [Lactococcus petauri]